MRGHEHDHEQDGRARPPGERAEREDHALLGRAVAAGRPEVLGAGGVLGLQRAVGNAGVASALEESVEPAESPVHEVVGSGRGAPLDAGVRADMEGRFGTSFADVRVHTDGAAHSSARSVNAQAYTVGSNIVFQSGGYDPGSAAGRHVLAHELTHVVQQRNGPVDGSDVGGGVRLSDPSDRFEREASANADRLMAQPAGQPAVQRVEEEAPAEDVAEEPVAQTYVPGAASVQRSAEEGEGEGEE
ncbi:DUF4157 domain-containing protein [Actinosynnema mirum]|uniref:eCIS core domain-containing protein n=1 Tax=Actinosynnema mirum (strain ATCC 29888 / DSM 43827 / JCM 3225 / NBRC 14064 / NCIMB 13271 / NRRL B-12336 / IMRU 3971 / 101) TaxID=446462 RepID=C6WA22_ACTMD|nr:DUF4157 domain-containing protein [Actinosynnema mirum]ACU39211.1 hypothetical protein Amir_5392 [Actinosynnema mirum DSM 43827]